MGQFSVSKSKFKVYKLIGAFALMVIIGCATDGDNRVSVEKKEEISNDSIQLEYQLNKDRDYELVIEFKENFEPTKNDSIRIWINRIFKATTNVLGKYPFDTYVNIFPASSSSQTVPFGLASRKDGINQVKLYVNEEASFNELMEDWTAPHELSHLALPFLGQNNKWFSEGFATYCSRRIMIDLGYFTEDSFEELYVSKVAAFRSYFNSSTSTFAEVADSLLSHHRYSPIYWGGSTFFMIMDARLQEDKGWRFTDLVTKYQANGRLEDKNLKQVMASFDTILGYTWCTALLTSFRNELSYKSMKRYDER